jgi:hypothetical protein
MRFFDNFPSIAYSFNDAEPVLLTHILRRFTLVDAVKGNAGQYQIHTVIDGETPDQLATRFYDDSELHWVIMIYNDITDVNEDWPMSVSQLDKYCLKKYGTIEKVYDVLFYVDEDGDPIAPEGYQLNGTPIWPAIKFPVTNYDYESSINDAKRVLKIPSKSQLASILQAVEKALENA